MKKLGFGLMRLPMNGQQVDIEKTKQMVDEFMTRGFTYFDTAWMYCNSKSESAIKECLVDRYPRDSYTLTTKLPSYEIKSFEDRDRVFNEQKRRTGLDYFDYYWLHAVSHETIEAFDKWNCWDFIKEKKEKGEVKHIGFSFHDSAQMLDDLLNKHPEIEYVQLQLNYLDWLSDSVQSKACYEVCVKHNKPVIVMEPVRGGSLVKLPDEATKLFKDSEPNMSTASWAIRFAASLENVYMVLSGMTTFDQLKDNLSYMEDFKPLTPEQTDLCLQAAEIIKKYVIIPCTGCSYCTSVCPMQIEIPKYFAVYNADKQNGEGSKQHLDEYESLKNSSTPISECLKCGACKNICPQHLKVFDFLEKVKDYYEGEN